VVCDGFVGNVALKASEGLATMIGGFIGRVFPQHLHENWRLCWPIRCYLRSKSGGPPALQRRRPAGIARAGVQEPRIGRCLCLRAGAGRAYDAAHNQLLDNVKERIAHAAPLLHPDEVPSDLKSIPTI
jgi:phosphate acyltransferase